MRPSIEVRNIDKTFVGVHALKDVSFTCYPGQVHVLQGENGAGKSTLLKILTGMYRPDSGEIWINGEKVNFRHPIEAKKNGLAMVYQEMSLLPELTVAQNIYLNQGNKRGFTDERALLRAAREIAQKYNIEIDPYARTADLPIAAQQMVEILKALAAEPQILILDEPTSTLTSTEVDKLYQIVQELKSQGKTVLFISHRMEEIFRFGDYATILKDGSYIDTVNLRESDENTIIQLMVGRELKSIFPHKNTQKDAEVMFEVQNFSDNAHFHNINLQIRRGEIVGIGALDGQGQTQLFQAIAGLRRRTSGTVKLNGKEIVYHNVRKAMKLGIGYVPEDRKGLGLCLEMSVGDNLSMASLRRRQKFGFIKKKEEAEQANQMVKRLNIKTASLLQNVVNLSGGNQQKVSIGKILEDVPKVLLLNEPTRGIDVEAKQEIYRLLRSLADEGVAILCYTSDMMETIGLCDRVLTLYEGRITGELGEREGALITEENIMRGAMNQKVQKTTGLEDGQNE
ncbi:sugar ABC transporter ATP-binding protein [Lachnoclostridium sp. An131]|uniref:sugar ABC transporter ATP-binding protein n=1 Tax=Lachnoclostridium sp. An131 TaxID=1965555 RepID=UPI000B394F23|nr:sugar ABC transporter ATP-binding protein [Lachnoclostridium sp. An131]OUQ26582.1 sugar ABC transporter ATP-binding protein [Lachnoclostridium sp. An131]